jgi:hypothetical protein
LIRHWPNTPATGYKPPAWLQVLLFIGGTRDLCIVGGVFGALFFGGRFSLALLQLGCAQHLAAMRFSAPACAF